MSIRVRNNGSSFRVPLDLEVVKTSLEFLWAGLVPISITPLKSNLKTHFFNWHNPCNTESIWMRIRCHWAKLNVLTCCSPCQTSLVHTHSKCLVFGASILIIAEWIVDPACTLPRSFCRFIFICHLFEVITFLLTLVPNLVLSIFVVFKAHIFICNQLISKSGRKQIDKGQIEWSKKGVYLLFMCVSCSRMYGIKYFLLIVPL